MAWPSDSLRGGALQSEICNLKSNALALAPNQHTRYVVRCLAGLRQSRVRAMPAGVVGIMPRRAPFAMIALTATGPVQHTLVRPSRPVFIDVEIGRLRRRGWLADQSHLGSDLLQLGPRIAAHGQHGQPVHFFDLA